MTFTSVLAEGEQAASGGFNPMMIVLLLLVVLMVFMMFRNRKKAQTAQEQKKTQLVPGAKVMTTAGIFGTVRSVDKDDNKVVLEVSPGQLMTFHLQAVNTFLDDAATTTSAAASPADTAADAAAARGDIDLSKKDDGPAFGARREDVQDTSSDDQDEKREGTDGDDRRA